VGRKAVSSVDLTRACLEPIDTFNSTLNAFIATRAEQALRTAGKRIVGAAGRALFA
jgi:Asp-tRNA(Asn)/Glu-tRNA(Gln) amidotransferase A subunit family amidase